MRLTFRISENFPNVGIEADADALQRRKLKIFFPTFQRTVVGAMHTDSVCECFLAHPEMLSAFPHDISKPFFE